MADKTPTESLAAEGVSVWLDDLSRDRIVSGNLTELISTRNVTGVTTNPTIFQQAIGSGEAYAQRLVQLAAAGTGVDAAILDLTSTDVRDAADLLRSSYEATNGVDGRVSIEVSPELAHDTDATIAHARHIWAKVDRPNALIKIPATKAGLPAITAVLAEGISVNVTLIFGLERYAEVIDAYFAGLERAASNGIELSSIHSVASFFVSRVDTEVDKRLLAIGTDEALALKSLAGVANARLAYRLFESRFGTPRARNLVAAGAHVQRPLWASTGVKDASLSDTRYVTELVAPRTVNTMPEKTLEATFDHGEIAGNAVTGSYETAHQVFADVASVGVDLADVTRVLEDEGVEKFIASWHALQNTVRNRLTPVSQLSDAVPEL